jgi:YD repeat-containing protein
MSSIDGGTAPSGVTLRRPVCGIRTGAATLSFVRRAAAPTMNVALLIMALLTACPISAQSSAQFVYDAGGRLVQVIAPNGTSAQYTYDPAGNILAITPLSATTSAVTGFSSYAGGSGTTVTIYGSGFSTTPGNNLVYINGVQATVVSATTNSVTIEVPAGATSGTITVTSPNGSATSANNFAVNAAQGSPTITGFSPAMAPAGTSVTITGSNLQAGSSNSAVYFNGFPAPVTSSSGSALTVTVPSLGGAGPITVYTPAGTASSSTPFYLLPPGTTAANVGYIGTLNGGSATVTLNTPGQFGLVTLNGTAGEIVYLGVSGSTFPSGCLEGQINFYQPQYLWLGGNQFCTGWTTYTLPWTGQYTLIVQPAGSDTGAIALETYTTSSLPAPSTTSVFEGGQVSVTNASQFLFESTYPNEAMSIQYFTSWYEAPCIWQWVEISGPVPSVSQLFSGWVLCSNPVIVFPVPGLYMVSVLPTVSSMPGGATIDFVSAPPVMLSATVGGPAVSVSEDDFIPGQFFEITFTTTAANQWVSAQIAAPVYGGGQAAVTGPAPIQIVVGSVNLNTSSYNSMNQLNPSGMLMFLPLAGTYTMTLTPGNSILQGSVQLFNAAPVAASLTIGGSPVTVTTTVGGQEAWVSFTTTSANQSLNLSISNATFTRGCAYTYATVVGPSPSTYTLGGPVNVCTNSYQFSLATVGTYTIEIAPYFGSDTGSVTLQVN